MREDLVEMAERAEADMLAKEPRLARTDGIASGFTQQFLVGSSAARKRMGEQRQQWRKDQQPPHARLPLRPHVRAASGRTVTTEPMEGSSASPRSSPRSAAPARTCIAGWAWQSW